MFVSTLVAYIAVIGVMLIARRDYRRQLSYTK